MNALRTIRIVAWAIVAVAAVGLATLMLWPRADGTPSPVSATASIGGPFRVIDTQGNEVTEASLKGHGSAMFFGYTYCPDVCPTTLVDMTQWMEQLGADADKLSVYFVTVDPERDTPEQMASYLESFDPRIKGLTGEKEAIDGMLKAYRVYAKQVDTGEAQYYLMDHTASIYLLDKNGQFFGTIAYEEDRETAVGKLRRLANS